MFDQSILKGRRAQLWLFVELIVVTIVAWVVIDPAVVDLYFRFRPTGYDADRLVYAEWQGYDTPPMLQQLRASEGVEAVYAYSHYGADIHPRYNVQCYVCHESDTTGILSIPFREGQQFFEAFGLTPLNGSPSAVELSRLEQKGQQVVLSESAAKAIFGTADGIVGRSLDAIFEAREPAKHFTVAGVVADVQHSHYSSARSTLYWPVEEASVTTKRLFIRLRRGLAPERYIEEHVGDLSALGAAHDGRILRVKPYREYIHGKDLDTGEPQKTNMSLALAVFFLLNLCLSVIGTVWLQAKRRTEESGVRRAFGATRRRLLLSFLSEGAVLSTAAVLVGCIIYMNYAYSGYSMDEWISLSKLYFPHTSFPPRCDQTWVDSFWPHLLVVSCIVWLIVLSTVLIGTIIPALKIVSTRVNDALRDE